MCLTNSDNQVQYLRLLVCIPYYRKRSWSHNIAQTWSAKGLVVMGNVGVKAGTLTVRYGRGFSIYVLNRRKLSAIEK